MELSENLNRKLNQLCKKSNDFNKIIIKEFYIKTDYNNTKYSIIKQILLLKIIEKYLYIENLSNDIITINLYKYYISEIKHPKYSKSIIRNNNKIFKIYYVENCRDVGRLEKYLKFNKKQTKNKISIQVEQIIINRNNNNFNLLKRFRSYYNSEDNINNNKRKENIICGDSEIKEQEPSRRNESLQRVCEEEEKKSDNVTKEKLIVMKIKLVNKEIKEENTNSTLNKLKIIKIKTNSKKHNNIILNKNKAKKIKIIVLKEILSKTCNNRKDIKTLECNYKFRKKKKNHY
ncbi:hypothetical protein U3516DRAFT_805971 [Neocallimastix sp. 'constans']